VLVNRSLTAPDQTFRSHEQFCLRSSDRNWLANRRTNRFLGAACPAFVLARVTDRDGEVVARPVIARLCTGRTLGVVVPARLAPWFLDEVENRELFSVWIRIARRQCDRGWFAKKLVRDRQAEAEPRQLGSVSFFRFLR